VRWGGDEFACALVETTLDVVSDRVRALQTAVDAFVPKASIRRKKNNQRSPKRGRKSKLKKKKRDNRK